MNDTRNITTTERLLAGILDWVLPSPCVACGHDVNVLRPPLSLCDCCRAGWPRLRSPRCSICGRPLASVAPIGYRCGGCEDRRVPHSHLIVGWDYVEPVASTLRALKFHRLETVGGDLLELMLDAMTHEEVTDLNRAEVVTAVPLWWRRRLSRGYNQAEVLARALSTRLDLPFRNHLSRRHGGPPQSRLVRTERRRNVRDSMRGRRRPHSGKRILLVDDVITTGATLEEAAMTLRRAGWKDVRLLAIARTPDP